MKIKYTGPAREIFVPKAKSTFQRNGESVEVATVLGKSLCERPDFEEVGNQITTPITKSEKKA